MWEECNHTCPYTGQPITISQLFTSEIEIDHIFHWSRSLNDSFKDLRSYELWDKFQSKNDENWNATDFGIVMLASILPFGTFYVDWKYLRN
mgnify:CR=1 FL=1